jgi:diacylglycerol kinase (ATP)
MTAPSRVAILINPAAGGGRGAKLARPVADKLTAAGALAEVLVPQTLDQARELAADRTAKGIDALVVVGGDGMVHVGVNAVGETGTGLALVPCGSGNDYARAIGLSVRDPLKALDALCCGTSRQVDVLAVTSVRERRLVATVVAVGFDSRVATRASAMTRVPGHARYLAAIAAEMRALTMTSLDVDATSADGGSRHTGGKRLLVAVGVTAYYGGGLKMLPDADLADGLLDVAEIEPVSRRRLARLFHRLYRGTHTGLGVVSMSTAESVTLTQVDGEPVEGVGDGEPLGPLPLTLTCLPGALRLFA